MTSEELNAAISAAESKLDVGFGLWAESGKPVPYHGWYWRTVDFDRFIDHGYSFGVDDEGNVGFMQNNKWGHDSVDAEPDQCKAIHASLIKAVTTMDPADFKAVTEMIQGVK